MEIKRNYKPKIALVVDVYNWAFYNRAIILKEKLEKYYDITVIPADSALQNNMLQLILLLKDFDLVHFFWRRILFNLSDDNPDFKRYNIKVEEFLKENFSKVKKTTCIPDHLLLDEQTNKDNMKAVNFTDNYYTISTKLYDIYSNLEGYKKPYGVIVNGVNLDWFKPNNLERFENRANKKLVIGWSGNSNFGGVDMKEDIKGVKTILNPAVESLKEEGYNIEFKLADRTNKLTPIDKMSDYYNSIDVYVCTSKTEGGPNPIIESMACGVPIISTDVGFVKDILGEKQQEYILKERSIECLKSKIKQLYNNQKILKELSQENIKQSKKYSYDNQIEEYVSFFDSTLKES